MKTASYNAADSSTCRVSCQAQYKNGGGLRESTMYASALVWYSPQTRKREVESRCDWQASSCQSAEVFNSRGRRSRRESSVRSNYEDSSLQSGQRRDSQFHAASLDVFIEGAHSA